MVMFILRNGFAVVYLQRENMALRNPQLQFGLDIRRRSHAGGDGNLVVGIQLGSHLDIQLGVLIQFLIDSVLPGGCGRFGCSRPVEQSCGIGIHLPAVGILVAFRLHQSRRFAGSVGATFCDTKATGMDAHHNYVVLIGLLLQDTCQQTLGLRTVGTSLTSKLLNEYLSFGLDGSPRHKAVGLIHHVTGGDTGENHHGYDIELFDFHIYICKLGLLIGNNWYVLRRYSYTRYSDPCWRAHNGKHLPNSYIRHACVRSPPSPGVPSRWRSPNPYNNGCQSLPYSTCRSR